MAWAVPTFLEAVPMHDATDVRARGAPLNDGTVFGAVDRVLGKTSSQDGAYETGDKAKKVHSVGERIVSDGKERSLRLPLFVHRSPRRTFHR